MRFVTVAPGDLQLVESPDGPAMRPGDARVRVLACGVCRTDLELFEGCRLPAGVEYPVVPGHEVAGIVEELGPDADADVQVGDLVVASPVSACGACDLCTEGRGPLCANAEVIGLHRPGGMADELVWPARFLVPVHGVDPRQAALLPDAVATSYHALRLAEVPTGGRLCVIGAGGLGTHLIQLARALDPTVTVAAVVRSAATAARVEAMGVPVHVGLDTAARSLRERIGDFHVVVDFSGTASAPAVALRMLRPGGRFVLGSVVDGPLDCGPSMRVLTRELQIVGTTSCTLDDVRTVAGMLEAGRIDLSRSVTHRVPLSEAREALRLLESPPPGMVRAVVEPDGR